MILFNELAHTKSLLVFYQSPCSTSHSKNHHHLNIWQQVSSDLAAPDTSSSPPHVSEVDSPHFLLCLIRLLRLSLKPQAGTHTFFGTSNHQPGKARSRKPSRFGPKSRSNPALFHSALAQPQPLQATCFLPLLSHFLDTSTRALNDCFDIVAQHPSRRRQQLCGG